MVQQHCVKVVYTPVAVASNGTVTADTANQETLQQVVNAQVSISLGKKADSFIVKINDPDDIYFNKIKSKDLMKVYSSTDGGSSWVLEIDGTVRQTEKGMTPDDTSLKISGLNRLELLLGTIAPVTSLPGQSESPDYWIRQIIREVNTFNDSADYSGDESGTVTINDNSRYIYGGLLSEWNAVSNSTVTGKNTSPNFFSGEEIAFELIEKLSSTEYSGAIHVFYLDENNYFRWEKIVDVADGNLVDQHNATKITRSTFGEINYVIIKAGSNLFGNAGIIDFRYDLVRATAEGIKAKVIYEESIRREVAKELERKMRNEKVFSESTFPFPTSYNFTTPASWQTQTVATGDSSLNAAFVDEVLYRVRVRADNYLERSVEAGVKMKYLVPGGTDTDGTFLVGDNEYSPFTDSVQNTNGLRIMKRSYGFTSKKGWELALELEEDIKEAIF